MKKIAFLLFLSLMVLELPTLGMCKVNTVEYGNPPVKQQINKDIPKVKIKKETTKTTPKTQGQEGLYRSASCEFGVCQPKPPKR